MADLSAILKKLKNFPREEQEAILALLSQYDHASKLEIARSSFMGFVRRTWPAFIAGKHHQKIASAFDSIVDGNSKRVIINMAPRHTKSEFASYRLPAYFLGKYPNKKIIQASHTAELAVSWGRKVRDLVSSSDFAEIFPGVKLKADSQAAGRWNTSHGGEYYAVGVGGALAGRGADLAIIDDPHSEQDAINGMFNPAVWEKTEEWYATGPRQRLQPGGAIVLVMTRWSTEDLTGKILKKSTDKWEVIELPAILPSGTPIWPEFWSLDELESIKRELPKSRWSAQYQQNPTSEEGAIIRRDMWKAWEGKKPEFEYILQSWDTAYAATTLANYTVCTTWGVFKSMNEEGVKNNICLISTWRDKLDFPEMKAKAKELYKKYQPDSVIIEAKAAGAPLVAELRLMNIPVSDYTPTRYSGDKVMRVNSVTDIFNSGVVWYLPVPENDVVLEECATFPRGANDDCVDTVSQALMRFRQGGFIRLDKDEDDKWDTKRPHRAAYY